MNEVLEAGERHTNFAYCLCYLLPGPPLALAFLNVIRPVVRAEAIVGTSVGAAIGLLALILLEWFANRRWRRDEQRDG